MAGSQTLRCRGGRCAAVIVLSVCAFAGRTPAQNPSPSLPPYRMPAQSYAGRVDAVPAPETIAGPMTAPQAACCTGCGATPTACRVELGFCDTITQSLCGKPDPNTWRPLTLSTLFSEGWNEAWVPSPSGSGGAPRQGWINAADGNLYRLSFFTFAQGFNNPPKGNGRQVSGSGLPRIDSAIVSKGPITTLGVVGAGALPG